MLKRHHIEESYLESANGELEDRAYLGSSFLTSGFYNIGVYRGVG
jgi:hypothetical protein